MPRPRNETTPHTRTCLGCEKTFISRGDRLCAKCNNRNRKLARRAAYAVPTRDARAAKLPVGEAVL